MKFGPISRVALLAAALVVCGCKSGPKVAVKHPAFSLPPGWTKMENLEQAIAIGAPPGWVIGAATTSRIDLGGSAGLAELTGSGGGGGFDPAAVERANEEQAKIDVKALEEKDIYISCVQKDVRPIPGEERTRFVVYKKRVGGNVQLEDVVAKIQEDLVNEDAPQTVELPVGKAVKVRSKVTLKDGGDVTRIYYGIADGEDMVIVRFITEEANTDIEKTADQVVRTLRVGKA